MSEPDMEGPAGGWTIVGKLKSDFNLAKIFAPDTLNGIINAWVSMRMLRKEPFLMIDGVVRKNEVDPICTFMLHGATQLPLKDALPIMTEFATVVAQSLEQLEINLFVAGQNYTLTKQAAIRSPNIKLN